MVVVAVTIVFALFAVFEIIALKKAGKTKEAVLYCTLIGLAYVLSLLIIFDVQIPNIKRVIGDLIMPLTGK